MMATQNNHNLLDLNEASAKSVKVALVISVSLHLFAFIYQSASKTIFMPAIPQGDVKYSLQVSLKQEKIEEQKEKLNEKRKEKKVSSRKKATKKLVKQDNKQLKKQVAQDLKEASRPKTFDFYIQNYSEPIYPRLALRRGITGKVMLKLKVGKFGQVIQVIVAKSSGSDILDKSAVTAAKKWKFKPLAPEMASIDLDKNIVFTM